MPYASRFAPVDIPNVDLWTFLCERKSKPFADSKEMVTDADSSRSYSFGDLRSTALAFGRGLQTTWAWQPGDVLAFFTPNSIDTPAATLGLLWAGGVATPANPLYTARELAGQLRDAGARAILTQAAYLDTARAAAQAAGIDEAYIVLVGEDDPAGRVRHMRTLAGEGGGDVYEAREGGSRQTPSASATSLAFLVYSSGTTGLPKGVCLTHGHIVATILQFAAMDGRYFHPHGGPDDAGDKGLGVSPFFHIYGLVCNMFVFLYMGCQLVVVPRFDLAQACRLVARHRLTFAYLPPPVVLQLARDPRVAGHDLSSLRLVHSGGAPLPVELATALWDRLRLPVKQGYGLTETAGLSHMQAPDEWATYGGSVGQLAPNMEARIVDAQGVDVPEGATGELWLRGPNVFAQYHNRPESTRDAFSACGFFQTGDLVRRDRQGNYYCVDRLKELIKYKAFQVAPAELEGLLLGHTDIVDVGVVGIEDREQATEVPRAYVVLRGGCPSAEEAAEKAAEIVAWAAGQTAPHKKLRGGVHFVDRIPKSPSGKILRRVLRERGETKAKL